MNLMKIDCKCTACSKTFQVAREITIVPQYWWIICEDCGSYRIRFTNKPIKGGSECTN